MSTVAAPRHIPTRGVPPGPRLSSACCLAEGKLSRLLAGESRFLSVAPGNTSMASTD